MNDDRVPIAIIVAASANGVIGRDNQLPWRLSGELKYFKATTLGKPVVMGRKTFESIGRPLPGRSNIVVSRNAGFQAAGVVVERDLDSALATAQRIARRDGASEVMVIGGAEIYRQALPRASTLYLTRVHATIEGDAFFADVDPMQWDCVSREDVAAAGAQSPAYSLLVYRRRPL